MNAIPPEHLERLRALPHVLAREIRGQDHALVPIVSALQRGELRLTKPNRPRSSFLLLGPTGVGKTETVIVATQHLFGSDHLFRFDMSEYQNQESVGLMLGSTLRETGHLGRVLQQAKEGSILFDEVEKAHPRVLDLLLQLLDAARITVATGETHDCSGFHIWMTSNVGAADLLQLQHSSEATLERHVMAKAQATLRPEIFARVNERIVFRRLSYEIQKEIAAKFLEEEVRFLSEKGFKVEVETRLLPKLVRMGFDPKLGARTMRGTMERYLSAILAQRILRNVDNSIHPG